MKHGSLALLVLVALLTLAQQSYCAILRVKYDSPTDGPGDTWANAYHTITAALGSAKSGDEIWVARGRYVGTTTVTKPGSGLYGGFAGTETARWQRNWSANVCILDGNRAGRVLIANGSVSAPSVVSGFTITGGVSTDSVGTIACLAYASLCDNVITDNVALTDGVIRCASRYARIVNFSFYCQKHHLQQRGKRGPLRRALNPTDQREYDDRDDTLVRIIRVREQGDMVSY